MPRRSPGEIRAELPVRGGAGTRQVIRGLSAATNRQIAMFEVLHRQPPGSVAHAYRSWATALHEWPDHGSNHGHGSTSWRDMHARTLLEGVASSMRRAARREFLDAIAPLDARFLARTLQDPSAPVSDPWWKRRLG
ncbi:hypothetical protein KNE206_48640 [Kitasatospora sp. NE20-6]|uniref:hypothetical protein n=1 Tax=Kitasatospora sp. NE20-6 TaxID=2859066 RepID=UPI0034DBEB60